ncbi:MAG: uroporphyrinogen decarboxylase family protein [Anaerolineae bacterium]
MNARERVLAALNFEEADHIPIHDTLWEVTVDRWHSEGLPTDVSPNEFFDYDMVWFGADTSPLFPVKTLEETDRYIVETTPYGGIRRNHKDLSGTPELIDYPCKTRSDWERIKERLVPSRDRVDWEGKWAYGWVASSADTPPDSISIRGRAEGRTGLEGNRKARADGKFICYFAIVGYDKVQYYMNTEEALVTILTDPGWLRDMYETDADLVIEMCEIMRQGGFEFDGAFVCCDLGYRNGLFFSPRHFAQQLQPTLTRLFDYFHSVRMPVIMHSCGQVNRLIPNFVEAGLDCLQPLEVKAGMDVRALKEAWHRKIAFMGGIDVRAMADPDPKVLEEEIRSKLPIARRGGGYIYHSDHSVPNNVSFEQYRRVLELLNMYGCYA